MPDSKEALFSIVINSEIYAINLKHEEAKEITVGFIVGLAECGGPQPAMMETITDDEASEKYKQVEQGACVGYEACFTG